MEINWKTARGSIPDRLDDQLWFITLDEDRCSQHVCY